MKLVRLVKESRLKEWSTRRVMATQRGNEDTDQEDAGSKIQNKRKAVGWGSYLLVAHTSNEISLETVPWALP